MDIGPVVLMGMIALVLFLVIKNKKSSQEQEAQEETQNVTLVCRVEIRPADAAIPTPPPPRTAPVNSPEAPKLPTPIQEVAESADQVIVTRTTVNKSGLKIRDNWAGERSWAEEETTQAIELYKKGHTTNYIALSMQIDHKDVICRLTREYFAFQGNLDDTAAAPNHGLRWTADEHQELLKRLEGGATLDSLMESFGRTGLALGWRIFSQRLRTFR